MEYGWDTKLTVFLFSHSFLCRDFTDRRYIWHEALPIYQTSLMNFFWRISPGIMKLCPFFFFNGAVWRDMHFGNALVTSFGKSVDISRINSHSLAISSLQQSPS